MVLKIVITQLGEYQMLFKKLSTRADNSNYIKKTQLQNYLQQSYEQSETSTLLSEIGTLLSVIQTENNTYY